MGLLDHIGLVKAFIQAIYKCRGVIALNELTAFSSKEFEYHNI